MTPHDLDLEARRAAVLDAIGHPLPVHSISPHHPGSLYDCPACEAACFCTAESTACIYCSSLEMAS